MANRSSTVRFAATTALEFCVDASRLAGITSGPGDIDVLAIDPARPDEAIAIEVRQPGDASKQVDLQRRMIETLGRDGSRFEFEQSGCCG